MLWEGKRHREKRKDETYRIENRRESGAQTTGGSAGSNEFQAITTIEYFSDGTRWEVAEGRQRNGRPCVYYLLRYTRGKAKLSLPLFLCVSRTLQTFLRLTPITAGPVHHCTLFIRRNLNYTFNRNVETSRRDALSATTTFLSVLNYEN